MGCLVTIAIMLNVVMLNFSYDVPVKLFSMHLVLIALFIISPYLKRLIDFFIFQRTSNLHFKKMQITKKWVKITRIAAKSIIIFSFPVLIIVEGIETTKDYEAQYKPERTYITQTFVRTVVPDRAAAVKMDTLVSTDPLRWDRLSFSKEILTISGNSGTRSFYNYNIDTIKNKITLTGYNNSSLKYILNCNFSSDHLMTLSGFYQGDSIYAVMRKKGLDEYLLMNRGFHWINEYPYNR